jgi:hypothetical protein
MRLKHRSRRPREARIGQSEGSARGVFRGIVITLHKTIHGITPEPPAPTTQIMVITRSWTQDFIDYIKENKLLANREEATRIIRRSKNYVLIGDKLYRRATSSGVLLKCITREEGKEILEEIHLGCCGNHAATRTLVGKTFRTGFYWPTTLKDKRTSQTVQRVSNVREASSHTSSRTNLHPSRLAVRKLEARPSRSTQKGQRWF